MSSERDSYYSVLANLKREIKVLSDITEDLHVAVREESKIQLRDMRSRHFRHFVTEGSSFFKKLHEFWSIVFNDINSGGNLCMNPEDIIQFDGKIKVSTFFNQKKISEAIEIAKVYTGEVIDLVKPIA